MTELGDRELAKKHALGRAAARVFCDRGYLEASLDEVAEEAGVSKGSIYYYFTSKHELLHFILDTYVDGLLDGLEEKLKRLPPGAKRVEYIARRHVSRYNAKVPEARTLLFDLHNLPATEYRAVADKEKRYAGVLADALGDFFGGSVPHIHCKAIAYILFGMCNSIMMWHDPEGALKLDDVTELCLDVFLRGAGSIVTKGEARSGMADARARHGRT